MGSIEEAAAITMAAGPAGLAEACTPLLAFEAIKGGHGTSMRPFVNC